MYYNIFSWFFTLFAFLLWDDFSLRTIILREGYPPGWLYQRMVIQKDGYTKGWLYQGMVIPKDGYVKGGRTPTPIN